MYRDDYVVDSSGFAVQGDVPIVPIEAVPVGAVPVSGNIIREGEATGHHHVAVGEVQLYETPDGLVAEFFSEVAIKHQEHGTIIMPAGIYWFPMQVEYDGEEERRVYD